MCVCVCVRVCARVCVSVCVHVYNSWRVRLRDCSMRNRRWKNSYSCQQRQKCLNRAKLIVLMVMLMKRIILDDSDLPVCVDSDWQVKWSDCSVRNRSWNNRCRPRTRWKGQTNPSTVTNASWRLVSRSVLTVCFVLVTPFFPFKDFKMGRGRGGRVISPSFLLTHTCVYACMHVCVHIHTHSHASTHIHSHTCVCTHAHTHACTHTHKRMCACVHSRTHTHTHTHTHTYVHAHSFLVLLPSLWHLSLSPSFSVVHCSSFFSSTYHPFCQSSCVSFQRA